MENREIVERLNGLDRRVDKIYTWAAAAFLTSTITMGLSAYWINRWIEQSDSVQKAIPLIQTDLALIKREQERQSLESTRAWSLINKVLKEGEK